MISPGQRGLARSTSERGGDRFRVAPAEAGPPPRADSERGRRAPGMSPRRPTGSSRAGSVSQPKRRPSRRENGASGRCAPTAAPCPLPRSHHVTSSRPAGEIPPARRPSHFRGNHAHRAALDEGVDRGPQSPAFPAVRGLVPRATGRRGAGGPARAGGRHHGQLCCDLLLGLGLPGVPHPGQRPARRRRQLAARLRPGRPDQLHLGRQGRQPRRQPLRHRRRRLRREPAGGRLRHLRLRGGRRADHPDEPHGQRRRGRRRLHDPAPAPWCRPSPCPMPRSSRGTPGPRICPSP